MHCKVLAIESTNKNTGYENARSVLYSLVFFVCLNFVAFNSFGSYPRRSGISACPLWSRSCFSIKNCCTFKSKCKTEYWHYVNYHFIIIIDRFKLNFVLNLFVHCGNSNSISRYLCVLWYLILIIIIFMIGKHHPSTWIKEWSEWLDEKLVCFV